MAVRSRAAAKTPAARTGSRQPHRGSQTQAIDGVVEQLRALEAARRDGTIELPDGGRLAVTNLAKVFWPTLKLTKGDLLRYYATVSPFLLPAVADRPLVMKRFPNGIDKPAFYQQRIAPGAAAAWRPHRDDWPTTSIRSRRRTPAVSSAAT